MTYPFRSKLRLGHLRNERGSISVEAILMFPLLVWAFVAMFVFFEALREKNINLKATYTISDLMSRETETIDDDYLHGMTNIYAWLSRSQQPVSLRVTSVRYDEDLDQHIKMYSESVTGRPELDQDEIDQILTPHIPIMADDDAVIVVETWTTYDPIMDIGLTDTEIYNIVVTSSRFAGYLNYEGYGDGGGSNHDDGTGDDQSL